LAKKKKTTQQPTKNQPKPVGKAKAKIPASQNRGYIYLALAAVLVITLIAYWPCIYNGFTNWDDPGYITGNALIRQPVGSHLNDFFSTAKSGFQMGNYHPFTMITLAWDFASNQLNPKDYHVNNLILHIANVALVFWFVFLLFGRWEAAAITAVLFGIHPMHVESVAWVSERKDVLYTFFFLFSLVFYFYYLRKKNIGFYVVSLLFFTCSLLSKGQAVTLSIVLLLLDYFFKRKWNIKLLLEKLPFFTLSVVFGLLAISAQRHSGAIPESGISFINRFFIASYNLLAYLFRAVLPLQLSCFYPYPDTKNGLPLLFYIAPVIVLGLAFLVWWKWRTKRAVVFGLLFFLANIALLLQLFPVGSSLMFDRYTYIPYIGLFFLVGQAYLSLPKTGSKNAFLKPVFIGIFLVFFTYYAYAGYERCEVWKDNESLWTDCLSNYDNVPFAYNNLGANYFDQAEAIKANNPQEANQLYQKALGLYNKGIQYDPKDLDALHNRGNAYASLGKYNEAIADYSKVLNKNPNYILALMGRSKTYANTGKFDSATMDINRAIALDPNNPEVYNDLTMVHFNQGMYREAIEDCRKTLALNPQHPFAYNNMAQSYHRLNMYDSAIYYYSKMLEIQPGSAEAYYKRGYAKYQKNDYHGAIDDYTQSISFNPNDANVYKLRLTSEHLLKDYKSALNDALQAKRMGYPVSDGDIANLRELAK